MSYIIDTYNLIHAAHAMNGAAAQLTVRQLCQWIVASTTSFKATLVMDGRAKPDEPSENEFPEVNLVYSGTGIKADTIIGQIVELSGNRKKMHVVTNDRAVALHARRCGANAMSCETFLTTLVQGNPAISARARKQVSVKRPTTMSSGETEQWMKEFGFPQNPPPPTPTAPAKAAPAKPDRVETVKPLMKPVVEDADSPIFSDNGDVNMDKLLDNLLGPDGTPFH